MTVEEWLRAEIPGYPFRQEVLKKAALSPIKAKPTRLRALSLNHIIEDYDGDEDFGKSLTYATSTLYYSAAGVFSGSSRTEQVGDVRASESGVITTQSDREYYRSMGDKLRKEIGYEPEEQVQEQGGMFDATSLRTPNRPKRWI